jgi:uncharacterized protein (TIGR02996 family)
MPSDEQRAFWAAIRGTPEDDTPRLVYADWLDEHGDPDRAEFIRVQCALAKLGHDRRVGRKERVRLEPREKALLTAHGDHWLAPLRAALQGSNPFDREDGWLCRLRFRRGFLDGDSFGLESARRVAAACDALEPVDRVGVMECGAHYRHKSVAEIARWTGAGCVVGLSVAWGSDRDIAVVVRSKSLRNLRHLGVWHGKVTDEGMVKLAAWPFATTLQTADLKDNPITDDGASALADSPYLVQLRWLDLHGTQIGSAGRKRLQKRFGGALRM